MAEKYFKKCSSSLVIREIQIKTTLRFHLTPIRMAKIKNSSSSSCWQGYGTGEYTSIASRSINLYNHFGNQSGSSSENWKHGLVIECFLSCHEALNSIPSIKVKTNKTKQTKHKEICMLCCVCDSTWFKHTHTHTAIHSNHCLMMRILAISF